MWADVETKRDFVNFSMIASLAAKMIAESGDASLSIGVSGSWGVGKSSLMRLIEVDLRELDEKEKWIFVTFNAWLYQGYDDARAALLDTIFRALRDKASADQTLAAKATELLKRVDLVRAGGIVGDVLSTAFLGTPPGALGSLVNRVKDAFADGQISSEEATKIAGEAKDASSKADGLLKPKKEETIPAEIEAIRDRFRDLLKEMDARMVVLVDDLDRCLPNTVIGTLEAMRLFLFLERTAFVIAADEEMVRASVRVHFRDLSQDDAVITNYFDKLINVPLRVPALGPNEVRAYLFQLYADKAVSNACEREKLRALIGKRLASSWKGELVDARFVLKAMPGASPAVRSQIEGVDGLARLMTKSKRINGNPRLVKRFLNTLSIRRQLAELHEIAIPESVLAKLLLFERCASSAAFNDLLGMIEIETSGKSPKLTQLEAESRRGKSVKDLPDSPATWKAEETFIDDWLRLDPVLGDTDLRGALHVGRESLPVMSESDRLSPEARRVYRSLAAQKLKIAAPLSDEVKALSAGDRQAVTIALLQLARSEQTWGTPDLLHALQAVGENDAACAALIVDFLKQRPSGQFNAAFAIRIRTYGWLSSFAEHLAARSDIPIAVKNALAPSQKGTGRRKGG